VLENVKPKEYETFAEQKIDQRIGFVAFPIVNAIVWLAVVLLTGWVDSITVEPTVRHPNLRLAIALLPWVVNGLVLLWAVVFRRYIASGYLVCLGGLLVVGTVLGLIAVVSFFLAVPLTALAGPAGALIFMMLAIIASTWFMLKVMPMFRNWWRL
jgi:hypothetical protein